MTNISPSLASAQDAITGAHEALLTALAGASTLESIVLLHLIEQAEELNQAIRQLRVAIA